VAAAVTGMFRVFVSWFVNSASDQQHRLIIDHLYCFSSLQQLRFQGQVRLQLPGAQQRQRCSALRRQHRSYHQRKSELELPPEMAYRPAKRVLQDQRALHIMEDHAQVCFNLMFSTKKALICVVLLRPMLIPFLALVLLVCTLLSLPQHSYLQLRFRSGGRDVAANQHTELQQTRSR
jgi:hypothetical protein